MNLSIHQFDFDMYYLPLVAMEKLNGNTLIQTMKMLYVSF